MFDIDGATAGDAKICARTVLRPVEYPQIASKVCGSVQTAFYRVLHIDLHLFFTSECSSDADKMYLLGAPLNIKGGADTWNDHISPLELGEAEIDVLL